MSGRAQRRRTPVGRVREPDLTRFYAHAIAPVTPGAFSFEVTLLRPGAQQLDLADVTESLDWSEEPDSPMLTGSCTLRRPDATNAGSLPIRVGHRQRCRVYWAGRWYELWTMRCGAPDVSDGGTVSVALEDDMVKLRQSRRDYVFRRSRATRPFYCHEIAAVVAKRNGVKVGALARGRTPIRKMIRRNASALATIAAAYHREHEATGRKFVMRMRNGRLEVIPFRRNSTLFVLSDQLLSYSITQVLPNKPATVLTGKAVLGKGKAAKKLRHTVSDPKVRARLGYVRRERDFGRVKSKSELVSKTKRAYAKGIKIKKTGTVTTPLLPFVRRGDGVRVLLPGEGLKGKDSYVYVTAARHRVTASEQTSEFEWTLEDPYHADRERLEKEQRAKARARRRKR